MGEIEEVSTGMMAALRRAGYRATGSRRAVVDAIARRHRPFSSADILEEIQAGSRTVGRATIFRTIDVLQDLGMLDRVEDRDGGWGYVPCPQGHHHHAICSRCGLVVDLRGCDVERVAEREAVQVGFAITGHRLEYYGLCSDCQSKGES